MSLEGRGKFLSEPRCGSGSQPIGRHGRFGHGPKPAWLDSEAVVARHVWPLGYVMLWHHRLQARHRLRQLLEREEDDHRLEDMGMTRHAVSEEVNRPFWVPFGKG